MDYPQLLVDTTARNAHKIICGCTFFQSQCHVQYLLFTKCLSMNFSFAFQTFKPVQCFFFRGKKPKRKKFMRALIFKNFLYFIQTVSLFENTSVSESITRPLVAFFNFTPSSGTSQGWCILPNATSCVVDSFFMIANFQNDFRCSRH